MNNESQDARIEVALEMTPGPERDSLIASLDEPTRTEIHRLITVGDLAWESQFAAPPIEADPIAAMLGLVPNQNYKLDPQAFSRARRAAGLSGSGLAAKLNQRGWNASAREVFVWETRGPVALSPATVRAIAQILATTPERLTVTTGTAAHTAAATTAGRAAMDAVVTKTDVDATAARVRSTPRFGELVARYARLYTLSLTQAATVLEERMVATVHRGTRPDPEQMISSLEALMDALETRPEGNPDPAGDRDGSEE